MDSSPMNVVQDANPPTTVTLPNDGTNNIAATAELTEVQDTSSQATADWLVSSLQNAEVENQWENEQQEGTEQAMGIQGGDWLSGVRGARFYHNGKYITGYVDSAAELTRILEEYQSITGTSFPTVAQLSLATKASEDEYLQQRFLTPSARPRLFWQMHAGEPVIPFDGVPFISVGQGTDVPCVLAGRRKTTTQVLAATGDILPTKIRTHGCSAKISIRRILRYPTSRLPDGGVQGITAMRRLRKQVLEVLTAKICAGIAKPIERYYFSLPSPLAHDAHIVPEVEDPPSLIEPVHKEIISQIKQGITSTNHILEHIKSFVETTYGDNPTINIQDPTFNPTRYELSRYIYWLYKSGRVVDKDCPFRERYNLLKGDSDGEKFGDISDSADKSQVSEDSSLYNIVVSEGVGIEFSTPQVGAEETTATVNPIPGGKTSTPTVKTPRRTGSASSLIATPKSSVFDTSTAETPGDAMLGQTRDEVRGMLTILENQTKACTDMHALGVLRRQLTALCTELSMYLAGSNKRCLDASNAATPSATDDEEPTGAKKPRVEA